VTRFAKHHGIGLIQPELDFVDIPMDGDLPVFVDPFGISLCDDELRHTCNDELVSFFQTVISAIRGGDDALAERMLQRLSEPNETHLGVSKGRPQGRGISGKQAHDLYRSIASSKAAKSGLVSELSECDLFIDGIGADKVSDITTNIIRRHLIAYTQRQCELHNVELRHRVSSGFMWDEDRRIWREEYTFLPSYKGQRLLLVPKVFVRRRPALESQEYLEHHVPDIPAGRTFAGRVHPSRGVQERTAESDKNVPQAELFMLKGMDGAVFSRTSRGARKTIRPYPETSFRRSGREKPTF
jgi:hypothetical protein